MTIYIFSLNFYLTHVLGIGGMFFSLVICNIYLHTIAVSPVLVGFLIVVTNCLSKNNSLKRKFILVPGVRGTVHPAR